jgi:hypothetical protein
VVSMEITVFYDATTPPSLKDMTFWSNKMSAITTENTFLQNISEYLPNYTVSHKTAIFTNKTLKMTLLCLKHFSLIHNSEMALIH